MEKTADIDDDAHFLKQLALISGRSEFDSFFSSGYSGPIHGRPQNPLRQFGLFLKDDYTVDVVDDCSLFDISNCGVQADPKMKMARQREAVRNALQTMEKTADIDDDAHFLKQHALMTGSSEYDSFFNGGYSRSTHGRPQNLLQQFCLFLKDDYIVDAVDDCSLFDISNCGLQAGPKMKMGRHREVAGNALQKMEKTAKVEDNFEILKELAMISGYSDVVPSLAVGLEHFRVP